jgi:hypothetical protein
MPVLLPILIGRTIIWLSSTPSSHKLKGAVALISGEAGIGKTHLVGSCENPAMCVTNYRTSAILFGNSSLWSCFT